VGVGSVLALVVGIILIVLFWPGFTTTTTVPPGPPGICKFWGDPHVETFDRSFPSFYSEGEFWLVRSEDVEIQGRFMATPFTNGLSATHAVAIGGKFVNYQKIQVGPMENGQILFNGQPVLEAFPSSFTDQSGLVRMTYNGQGPLVDNAQSHLTPHIVHIDLPRGVHVDIMRWANHVNLRITMPNGGVIDGYCGNWNGNPDDDTAPMIKARMGGRVPISQLLFHTRAAVGNRPQLTIADCSLAKRQHAETLCKNDQPGSGAVLLDSCIWDVCFGGDQYAGEDSLEEVGQ